MSKLKVNEIYKHSGDYVTIRDSLSTAGAVTLGSSTTFKENVTMEKDLDVVGNLDVTGYATISGGYITIGDADSDRLSLNADITSSIMPDASNTYDLGSSTKKWNYIYFSTLSGGHNSAISVSSVDATDGNFLNNMVIAGFTDIGGALSSASIDTTGNIRVDGTVDGRDVATDGSTLDAIPATYVAVAGDTMTGDLVLSGDGVDLILRQGDADYSAVLGSTSEGDGGLYLYGPGDTTASDIETQFRGGNYNSYISAGNFGLGHTNPSEKLTVVGNISSSGTIEATGATVNGATAINGAATITGDTSASGDFRGVDVKASRYLTVGLDHGTDPSVDPDWATQYKFQVEGDALIRNSGGNFALCLSGTSPDVVIRNDAGHYQAVIGTGAEGGGIYGYPSSETQTDPDIVLVAGHAVNYLSAGNFGLGETNPAEKLSVAGTVSAQGFKAGGATGQTTTVSVSTNEGDKTLTFTDGLLTGVASV